MGSEVLLGKQPEEEVKLRTVQVTIGVFMIIAWIRKNITPERGGFSDIGVANRPLFVNGLDVREVRTIPLEALTSSVQMCEEGSSTNAR